MPESSDKGTQGGGSKYRVLLELGQGGTANVFLAVARGPGGFNKLVVLKALKRNLANELEVRRSFLHEARLSARLSHPNIVAVNEVVEQEGVPVLVMEYLEGRPLSEIVAREGLELKLQLRVISDALSGLHYSHELTDYDGTPLRLVHRDMTPHNVFVTYDGVVKILDFGVAKIGAIQGDSQTGVVKGKLRYMAPEQITGDEIDRRTDIFAVGVMLWEAAAGDRMWRDMGESTIMNRLVNGEFPSPRDVRPSCPSGLESICMKAMAYRKEDRHTTAAELQLELECLLGEMGQQVTSHDVGKRVSHLFADTRQQTRRVVEDKLRDEVSLSLAASGRPSWAPGHIAPSEIAHEPARRERRERWAMVAMMALMVLLAAAAAWWLARRQALPQASANASAPPPAPGAAEPATVLIRITVFPARAAIYLDDQPVWANPFSIQKPADRRTHTVRAEAPGHVTSSREIRFDRNVDLVIALDPEPADSAMPKSRGPGKSGEQKPSDRSHTEPAPGSGLPSCDPPYSVDERGIKKFKPECL
jgi:serine/threonine protein kinase